MSEETVGDAWGAALLDELDGRPVTDLALEVAGGDRSPAMQPAWFLRPHAEWDWWERELLALVDAGPVLDLGCGAGRAALHFQAAGLAVTAVDTSPGAVEVCRRRGVRDARLGDVNEPPADQEWGAVLLLCGNLGLGGSWDGNRRLLRKLSQLARSDALLVGDSVNDPTRAPLHLRLGYEGQVTPWWSQRNVCADEIASLVDGTGWVIERHLEDGMDHAVALRNRPAGATDDPLAQGS